MYSENFIQNVYNAFYMYFILELQAGSWAYDKS